MFVAFLRYFLDAVSGRSAEGQLKSHEVEKVKKLKPWQGRFVASLPLLLHAAPFRHMQASGVLEVTFIFGSAPYAGTRLTGMRSTTVVRRLG